MSTVPILLVAVSLGCGRQPVEQPLLLDGVLTETGNEKELAPKPRLVVEPKTVVIPFDAAVVNLAEERVTRYLRVKISLVVSADAEKEVTAKLTAKKADMKSWLLSHLCSKTLKDASGKGGMSNIQRELLEHFADILDPDGKGHLRNVLFDEFVIQ